MATFMNTQSGAVFSQEEIENQSWEWYNEYAHAEEGEILSFEDWKEQNWDNFEEVVENVPGQPGYDEAYGQWRPAR